jgi:hypothetical protein
MLAVVIGERSIREMIEASPALRRSTADFGESWALTTSGVLNVYGDLSSRDVRQIADLRVAQIQFARRFPVSRTTLRLINDHILAGHPDANLRETLNGSGAFDDLGFLEHLPLLRSLGFNAFHDVDVSPIRKHVALEVLGIGGHRISLQPLRGYESLTSFGLGEKVKDLESISTFRNLRSISIMSQSLPTLAFLRPLEKLTSLSFGLGGTRNFRELDDLSRLEELSIWRTLKLESEHLHPLNGAHNLRRLHLHELPRILSLDWLTNPTLRTVEIEAMRGLRDYGSLGGLPSLETLIIKNPVEPAALASLRSSRSLKEVRVWQGVLVGLHRAIDLESLPFTTVGI